MEEKAIPEKNNLYPVFLKLEELEVLLVGAGNVGLEKLQSLLSNSPGTKITVVAPFVKKEVIEILKNHPACVLEQREFEETDLAEKDIVILATDDEGLHKRIRSLARAKHLLVNVADTPGLCDFYLSSVVQKGNLKVAISTNGKSPTAAKRIRQLLEEALPDDIDELLLNLNLIRNTISGDFAKKVKELNELTRTLVEKNK